MINKTFYSCECIFCKPLEMLEMKEEKLFLRRFINKLDSRKRRIIKLVFWNEKKDQEIANLGIIKDENTGLPLTRERVGQIRRETIKQLSKWMKKYS